MPAKTPFTPFALATPAGNLAAVLHPAPGKDIAILCHGFGGSKTENGRLFVQTARAFQKAGINVLRFDFLGSGDSDGDFSGLSPNSQIRDALAVLSWARKKGYARVILLGLSFGGATTICATHQAKGRQKPDALLTWSSVPSFRWWRTEPPKGEEPQAGNPLRTGKAFFADRPKVDVPEAYVSLTLPRLQIQGDNDIPGFRERFEAYCPKGDPSVRHLVLPGADHVFTKWEHRVRV
ncbi:MAG TPA: alpha/beta fold hydrolase, partial [Candidatus Methylacidiphilales bacterium]